MISNRASDAGTPKRRMSGTKTLAAALVLSFAGISAAHACNGDLVVTNNTDREIDSGYLYTETDGGAKKINVWSSSKNVAPGATERIRMYKSRGKNILFHIVMDTATHGRLRSTNGRCRDNWFMNVTQ